MTPVQVKKRREARTRELADWTKRKTDAMARCNAISDPAELADALRDYLLAVADLHEFQYGMKHRQHQLTVQMWRRRANDVGYRTVMACHWLTERLMKSADNATGMTPAERKEVDDILDAESRAFMVAVHGMIARAHSQIRGR